jgi:hypothetical protein
MPKTRIRQTGEDARLLLRHVHRYLPALRDGEQLHALRQIFVQNYYLDADDRPKGREPEDAGLPPSAVAIVSPYDTSARSARRGETRWKGFLAYVTETCDQDTPSVTTDVTTTRAPVHDTKALPGIPTDLEGRKLLSKEHFVDGGYLSVALKQQVTCPQGKAGRRWSTPPPSPLRQRRLAAHPAISVLAARHAPRRLSRSLSRWRISSSGRQRHDAHRSVVVTVLFEAGGFPREVHLLPGRQSAEAGHLDGGVVAETAAGSLGRIEHPPPLFLAPPSDRRSHHDRNPTSPEAAEHRRAGLSKRPGSVRHCCTAGN